MASYNSAGYPVFSTGKANTITLANANRTLSTQESGSYIFVPQPIANRTITLPAAPGIGTNYTLIMTDTGDDVFTFTIAPAAVGLVTKLLYGVAGAGGLLPVYTAGANSLVTGAEANLLVGDRCYLYFTGAVWVVTGFSSGAAAGWV